MALSHEEELRLEQLASQLAQEAPRLSRMLHDFDVEPTGGEPAPATADLRRSERRSQVVRSSLGAALLLVVVAALFPPAAVVALCLALATAAGAVLLTTLAVRVGDRRGSRAAGRQGRQDRPPTRKSVESR